MSSGSLDIRVPMGTMFSLLGFVLAGWGAISYGSAEYGRSLGVNVNLWWGLVILLFGLSMLALAWRSSRGSRPPTVTPPSEPALVPPSPLTPVV